MFKAIEAFGNLLAIITSVASRLMLFSVALMLFVQVILRYGFNYSLPWPEEASRYLMIWVVMLSGSLLVKDEQLVSVDFLDHYWSPRWLAYRNAAFRLLLAALLGVMLWKGIGEATFGARRMATSLPISFFWIYLAVPVGSGLMLFHMVTLAIRDILRGPVTNKDPSILRAEI